MNTIIFVSIFYNLLFFTINIKYICDIGIYGIIYSIYNIEYVIIKYIGDLKANVIIYLYI